MACTGFSSCLATYQQTSKDVGGPVLT